MHGSIELDPFDPNNWGLGEPHEYRIWGDNKEGLYALVDEIDYHWAVRWCWAPKVSRGGKKVYLYRTCSIERKSIYLHVAVMERTGKTRPSPAHKIVDHRNGNSLDCHRANLRWATPAMNRLNLFGAYPHDLIEG